MAGRALSMSSQLVGKHVAALEGRLGVQLLVRTTRRHSVTEAGQAFYGRCRAVVREAEEAETAAAEFGSAPRGQLTISAPCAPMPDEAADVALAYAALRDDILRGTTASTGFGHAARVARLVEDMLDSSRTGAWKPAAGWPEQA